MRRRGWVLPAVLGLVVSVALVILARPRGDEAPPSFALPAAPVRHGAASPTWTVALFVDLEASEARHAFAQATRAVSEGLLVEGAAELRLLHAAACPPAERERLRCAGARAIECAERFAPGAGIRLAGALLDLQWEAPELQSVGEALRRTRVADAEELGRCVREDAEVEARVTVHAAFAATHGLEEGAGGFLLRTDAPARLAPFRAGDPAETLAVLSVCLARGRCEEGER